MKDSTIQIFNDLDKYLRFCVEFGYVYDEKDLYDRQKSPYVQYIRYEQGKRVTNQWKRDKKLWLDKIRVKKYD